MSTSRDFQEGFVSSTGCLISNFTIRNLNIGIAASDNELIFLSMIETPSKFILIKTSLDAPFIKHHYWPQQKRNLLFHRWTKKNNIQSDAKVILPKIRLNITTTARANELIFLSIIEGYTSFIVIKTCPERPFDKYFVFSICEKVQFFWCGQ